MRVIEPQIRRNVSAKELAAFKAKVDAVMSRFHTGEIDIPDLVVALYDLGYNEGFKDSSILANTN